MGISNLFSRYISKFNQICHYAFEELGVLTEQWGPILKSLGLIPKSPYMRQPPHPHHLIATVYGVWNLEIPLVQSDHHLQLCPSPCYLVYSEFPPFPVSVVVVCFLFCFVFIHLTFTVIVPINLSIAVFPPMI